MRSISNPSRPLGPLVALAALVAATHAQAEAPVPTASTPTMIGGNTIGSGRFVIGASTGYPETQLRLIWGLGSSTDIGLTAGLTYGNSGIRPLAGQLQRVGLDLQVPIRFALTQMRIAAVGLRVVPYARIGQYNPSLSGGATVGFRFNIALPKIFSIIVGADTRVGITSLGCNGCGDRRALFEGATYAVFGLETLIANDWFVNVEFDGGVFYASRNYGAHGLYNAHFGFGTYLR